MEEIWKDIEGYEGLYEVSNMGRVKSLERTAWCGRGYRTVPEKILKGSKDRGGYLQVYLSKDGKTKFYLVHRLVATAFLPNLDNLPQVNHIDENKENNCMKNLEWCDSLYNNTYNGRANKIGEKLRNDPNRSKTVIAIHKINGLILEFPSAHEASRQTGINQGNIVRCCNGKLKSAGEYHWQYLQSIEPDRDRI